MSYFEFSTIRCFSDEKLVKPDSSTESWVIMLFTEITIDENQNFSYTKLIRLDSSTNFLLNLGTYKTLIIVKVESVSFCKQGKNRS